MVSCVDHDLLTHLYDLEIEIDANDQTEDALREWLEESQAVSSKDLALGGSSRIILRRSSMSQELLMSPLESSRIIDLWTQWNTTKSKYGIEYVLEDPKRKKE